MIFLLAFLFCIWLLFTLTEDIGFDVSATPLYLIIGSLAFIMFILVITEWADKVAPLP